MGAEYSRDQIYYIYGTFAGDCLVWATVPVPIPVQSWVILYAF